MDSRLVSGGHIDADRADILGTAPVGLEVVGELRHHLSLVTLTGKQQAHRVQIVKQTTAAAQGEPID